ncbi:unnamed protein product [Ilex paraguariensis]|uniref:Uncharacterized protein n=1 Tax=Ilex paraguariensis TaxID=185542 RepID=A0ABC8U5P5_9AQUA
MAWSFLLWFFLLAPSFLSLPLRFFLSATAAKDFFQPPLLVPGSDHCVDYIWDGLSLSETQMIWKRGMVVAVMGLS